MKRRTFLKTSAIAAGACLTSSLARPLMAIQDDNKYLNSIGLQLWTVRNQLEKDRTATLKAVKDAGYHQAELMKTVDAPELVAACKDAGLKVTSAFMEWTAIGKPEDANAPKIETLIEKANEAGLKHLVFGYIGKGSRENIDQYKQHAERANKAGELCKKAGIQLCYHNHSFEFVKLDGEKTGYDILIDEFDAELCKFEVDVFWVKLGGWDPITTLKRLDGRVSQVHLKDLLKGTEVEHDEGKVPTDAFQELGDGTIDMAEVLKVSADIGVEQCHVEQDQSPDPVASIGQSLTHLKKI